MIADNIMVQSDGGKASTMDAESYRTPNLKYTDKAEVTLPHIKLIRNNYQSQAYLKPAEDDLLGGKLAFESPLKQSAKSY